MFTRHHHIAVGVPRSSPFRVHSPPPSLSLSQKSQLSYATNSSSSSSSAACLPQLADLFSLSSLSFLLSLVPLSPISSFRSIHSCPAAFSLSSSFLLNLTHSSWLSLLPQIAFIPLEVEIRKRGKRKELRRAREMGENTG
jgi:hypothetical protein